MLVDLVSDEVLKGLPEAAVNGTEPFVRPCAHPAAPPPRRPAPPASSDIAAGTQRQQQQPQEVSRRRTGGHGAARVHALRQVGRDPGLSGANGRSALLHHRSGPPGAVKRRLYKISFV